MNHHWQRDDVKHQFVCTPNPAGPHRWSYECEGGCGACVTDKQIAASVFREYISESAWHFLSVCDVLFRRQEESL